MTVEPARTPVTTPLEAIVATEVVALFQVPPPVVLASVVVVLSQIVVDPVMAVVTDGELTVRDRLEETVPPQPPVMV